MHGNRRDPEIPMIGNKVIGVRYGTLDIHGLTRTPQWTFLVSTADAGSSFLILGEDIDWEIGEEIIIAPTCYDAE